MKRIFMILISIYAYASLAQTSQLLTEEWNVYFRYPHNQKGFLDGGGSPSDAYTLARSVVSLDFMGILECGIQLFRLAKDAPHF